MSNTYFQFKQFRIEQDSCAMKVSTDACIQGAWTPVQDKVKRVMDIGAGTGLLSLMLAQKNEEIIIDAIELDQEAAIQAKENIAASIWADRINLIQADVSKYHFSEKYDLIICNPPFFQNSLLGPNAERNIARHNLSLTPDRLFSVIQQQLHTGGYASVMLPVAEHEEWERILEQKGWGIIQKLSIRHKRTAVPGRVISLCGQERGTNDSDETLVIYDNTGAYTPEFTKLMRPYYLHL